MRAAFSRQPGVLAARRPSGPPRLAALLLLGTAAGALLGAGPPARRPDVRDVEVTLYARRALVRDPVLAPLNLFVHVEYGVATVSGPVPSKEVAERVVNVLREVKGVYEVRSDLRLTSPPPEEAIRSLLAGLTANADPLGLSFLLPPSALEEERSTLPGTLLGLPRKRELAEWLSARPDLPEREREEVDLSPARPRPAVSLGAPVALSPPSCEKGSAAVLLPPGGGAPAQAASRPVPASFELQAAAERLRAADPRFQDIRIEVRESVLVLTGQVLREEEVMELAQTLARLPGVRRVDVRQVETRR